MSHENDLNHSMRHVLTDYQLETVLALQGVINRAIAQQIRAPEQRYEIAKSGGVMLLQSPTASGKTLMLGRTLEGMVGKLERKIVWFWFAPYSGLVDQTVEALSDQCPGLRLRDATRDREPALARDGDVFVNTWGAVAANNSDARKVRRTTEDSYSLDQMLSLLRLDGFAIGVVIDEAHLNFGTGAQAAANFYLDHLKPDVTILATATPSDDKLERFAKDAGVEVGNRIVVSRDRVVERGLNKYGLMVGIMRLREQDVSLVDPETAALSCAWYQHQKIKERLRQKDLGVVPLMLVQVEDQKQGEDDPVERAKQKLISIGIAESKIATHTSGKPDPEFHTLAFDPLREVLIFKVAVATGFDAPRAWTLVSLRPSRGKDFGLQIVGRIMRVHPLVRPFHGQDDVLDRGYVFLADEELQSGLKEAADALDSVISSIDVVTSRLDFVELGTAAPLALTRSALYGALPAAPKDDIERQARLEALLYEQRVPGNIRSRETWEIDRAIQVAEQLREISDYDLFGGALPNQTTPRAGSTTQPLRHAKSQKYPLRSDLDVPRILIAEKPPRAEVLNSDAFNHDFARRFIQKSSILRRINSKMGGGQLQLRDLFNDDLTVTVEDVQIRLDDARIEKEGQRVFNFDDTINQRRLRQILREELRSAAIREGMDFTELDLSRAVYLAAMREPSAFKEALKEAKAIYVETGDADDPVPQEQYDYPDCTPSKFSAYGIVPSDLNSNERAFAAWLDSDTSGRVKWWLRNPHRPGWSRGWSTNLVLPSGGYFFPDFIVSVQGRSTPNQIALVEVKGGHLDNTDDSLEKIGAVHRAYQAVFWTQKHDDLFLRLAYDSGSNRLLPNGRFNADLLLRTTG